MEKYYQINREGCNIRCKLYCNDPKTMKKAVIYGHGFGGHKDNKAAERFAERVLSKYRGIGVVCFDLPCHGDDVRKSLSLRDCSEYLKLVIEDMKDKYHGILLYGYATSFGGYLFLKYIHDNGNPFEKLALRSPAVNMYESITTNIMSDEERSRISHGKTADVGFDKKIRIDGSFLAELKEADIMKYDFIEQAESILIIHGSKDEIISMNVLEEFSDRNVIEIKTVKNADHRFMDPNKMNTAIEYITEFFGF